MHLFERAVGCQTWAPGGEDVAGSGIERSELADRRAGDVVEVAAGPQDIVRVQFHVAHAAIRRAHPCGVKCPGRCVELDQVVGRLAVDRREATGDPHGRSVGLDAVYLGINVGVKRGIELARYGVELCDSDAKRAVNLGEAATDVEIGFVGRECNCINDARTAADHGGKRRVDVAGGYVDRREAAADFAANLIEIACDVVEAVGLEGFIHRCAVDADNTGGRWLGGVDICGAQYRCGWVVGRGADIVEP